MLVNGDYRGSNYTVSSDDEIFNVSTLLSKTVCQKFPPIKKQMHQAMKDVGSVYSNQIVKPIKKKPSPKMTVNMAGLGYNNNSQLKGFNIPSDVRNAQLSLQASSLTGLTNLNTDATGKNSGNSSGINVSGISMANGHDKMKHNSPNNSFHSQKKGPSMMHQATSGITTIRRPPGHNLLPMVD